MSLRRLFDKARRLSSVRGLTTADLLVVSGPTAPPVADNNVLLRELGATLAALEVPVPVEAVAHALGTDLETLTIALDALAAQVAAAGLEVQNADGMVRLAPIFRTAPVEALQSLTRRHLARVQLDISQANLVSRTVRGEKWKLRGNAERVTKGILLNAGIIETTGSGGFQLTADAAYSLLVETPG